MALSTIDKFILSPLILKNESGIIKTFKRKQKKSKYIRESQIGTNVVDCSGGFGGTHVNKFSSLYGDELMKTIRNKFERALDKEECVCRTKGNNVVSKHLYSYNYNGYPGSDTQPYGFSQHIPELNDILLGKTKDIIEQYYGSYFEPDFIKISRNLPISDELAKKTGANSTSWHLDRGSPDYLKIFVNLHELTQDLGPTQILDRPTTKNYIRPSMNATKYYQGELAEKMGNGGLDDKIITANGEAGTVTFANTHKCLHRAGITKNGVRDIITIQIKPSNKELPKYWLHNDIDLSPTH